LSKSRLRGVIAAAATPVHPDYSPDVARLLPHLRHLLETGCDAINLLGTTGEANSFGLQQRLAIMRDVKDAGMPMDRFMVGTGVCSLDETVALTQAAADLGFAVGPRLNAAGRLEDMSTGIECLLARDHGRAYAIATKLDALNRERRDIESKMQDSALAMLDRVEAGDAWCLTMHHPDWHPGVVGILASRLKDRFHRPVFAFATEGDGTLRGSGRSIAALHLRDALDLVDKRNPGLLVRFGGHAAAAGATLRPNGLETFRTAMEAVARESLTPSDLDQTIDTDGTLAAGEMNGELAYAIQAQVWGQGFPEPRFVGRFTVEAQRVVAERHLKLTLACDGRRFSAIRFGSPEALPASIQAVYRLDIESYQGAESLQLTLEHCQPL